MGQIILVLFQNSVSSDSEETIAALALQPTVSLESATLDLFKQKNKEKGCQCSVPITVKIVTNECMICLGNDITKTIMKKIKINQHYILG